MRRQCIFALAALLVLAAGSARAQTLEQPRARQGYWIGVGFVDISSYVTDQGKNLGFYKGYGATFRIGQLLTERLGLGLLVETTTLKKGSDKGRIGGLTLEGSATVWHGWSAHIGVGLGYESLTDQSSNDKSLRGGYGSNFLVGTSYDLFPWHRRRSGGWAITPTIDFHAAPDGNVHAYTVFFNLQGMWWSGLDRSMLLLPEE